MKSLARHPKSYPRTDMPSLFHALRSLRDQAKLVPPNTPLPYIPTPEDAKHSPKAPLQGTLCYHDSQCVIVTDPFRKSQVHCVVMPWDTSLKSLNDIEGPKHLSLLEHLRAVGMQYAGYIKNGNGGGTAATSSPSNMSAVSAGGGPYCDLRMLSIPSLPMLHMHLISLDLESARLKSKTHYNTFATYYFLPADMVIEDVKKNGFVTLNQDVDRLEALAAQPMVCLWCGASLKTVPHMKEHVPNCPKNMSREPQK